MGEGEQGGQVRGGRGCKFRREREEDSLATRHSARREASALHDRPPLPSQRSVLPYPTTPGSVSSLRTWRLASAAASLSPAVSTQVSHVMPPLTGYVKSLPLLLS